jgi:SpoVK/Ycf46/Vps4 family AAA+-type ATPase
MKDNQSIINALKEAVTKDPENPALRLHLASLYLKDSNGAEALAEAAKVLSFEPDNADAVELAAQAAVLAGQPERARGYQRLLGALRPTDEQLSEAAPAALPLSSQAAAARPAEGATDTLLDESDEIWELEDPGLKLSDVAGMENVKHRLQMTFLAPLKNPELMKLYGKSLRGGLLLYGPPGCGKTFIARALAGELRAKFVAIALSDVLDMWIGNSEKNLHEIFEQARRKAPCVLFLDEIDALGRKRTLVRHSAMSGVVNQLLAEMDSLAGNNDGVYVLAATNHPWDVDTALRRPGRLDRMLLVLPPDLEARLGVLQFHLRDRLAEKLDLHAIAKQTDGFSGADLAHLCESAAELALSDSVRMNRVRPINLNDFKAALKSMRPSARAWFDTARNFALFANEGGIYDDLLDYLKRQKII